MSKAKNLLYLKECFSGVGSDSPDVVPIPLYFFKLDHAKLIMEYLMTTLFHHYSLYEYLFTQEQDELIVGADVSAFYMHLHLRQWRIQEGGRFPP